MWLEWPEIEVFHDNDFQALLGDSLLLVPVLMPNATTVRVVKPPGYWYNLEHGWMVTADFDMKVTIDDFPAFIRGGRIVCLFNSSGMTTKETVTGPISLVIAADESGHASGGLYLDDGESLDYKNGIFMERNFTYDNGVLKCEFGSSLEKKVPDLLQNNFVVAVTVYYVKQGGIPAVYRISGVHKILKDSWIWHLNIDEKVKDDAEAVTSWGKRVFGLGSGYELVSYLAIGLIFCCVFALGGILKKRDE
jgi:hypothetical protein